MADQTLIGLPTSDLTGLTGGDVIRYDGSAWRRTPPLVIDVTAPPYNAVAGNTGNQATAIQAAIDACAAAGGGVVYFPPGVYRLTATLNMPFGKRIILRGAGGTFSGTVSTLRWGTDLGAGQYAIKFASQGTDGPVLLEHLRLLGPVESYTLGVATCAMRGVQMTARTEIHNCIIAWFYAGVMPWDHCTIRGTYLNSCYYGAYFVNSQNVGDVLFDNCGFTGNLYAGIACSPGSGIVTTTIVHGHFGFSPYGIWFEPGTACKMEAVRFYSPSFEACGHAFIADWGYAVNAKNILFSGLHDCSLHVDYKMAAVAEREPFAVGLAENWVFERIGSIVNVDSSCTSKLMSANTITGLRYNGPLPSLTSAPPFINAQSVSGSELDISTTKIAIRKPAAALTRKQLASFRVNSGVGDPAGSTTATSAQILGVLLNSPPAPSGGTRTEMAVVAIRGGPVTVDTTATVAGDKHVIPDPADLEKVKELPLGSQVAPIGYTESGVTGAGEVSLVITDRRPAVSVPAVTGSRGGNAALADLLTKLATLGLITDSSSA